MKVRANGIQIEVEDTGEADRPAVLLIMGLGMQLVAWPDAFVQGLRDDGWRVVRFDNRDAGLPQPGEDPMAPFPCGQDTARRIPGARLVPVRGMGHDLPPGVVERLLQALRPHLRQSAHQ